MTKDKLMIFDTTLRDGEQSPGASMTRDEKNGQIVNGQGADTDIVIASAKSYINALNKVINSGGRTHPQRGDV